MFIKYFFSFFIACFFLIGSVQAVPGGAEVTSPQDHFSYSSPIEISYSLPTTPQSGSVTLVFTGDSTITITLNEETDVTFDLDTSNVSSSHIISTTSSTIPDGIYNVTLDYNDIFGDPAPTTTITEISIDTVTESPTLALNSSEETFSPEDGIPIIYTIPDQPLAGSVTATVFNTDNTYTVILPSTSGEDLTATLDELPDHFEDGTYTIVLSYQDALANPTATDTISDVVVLTPSASSTSSSCSLHTNRGSGFFGMEAGITGLFILLILNRKTLAHKKYP